MSEELIDLGRMKVTTSTDVVLRALAHARASSKQQVAREVLDQYALKVIHESTVVNSLLHDKGHDGDKNG